MFSSTLLARFFLLFLFLSPCYAVEITDLYTASISVSDKSVAIRNSAVQAAFQSVLMKVGGQSSVLSNAAVKEAVSSYRNYLTQYGYVDLNGQTFVEANFDKERIRELFQKAGLAVWGRYRPLVLVWLVFEDGLSRGVISDSMDSPFPKIVKDTGDSLGLPLMLPIMDIADSVEVTTSDLWGRFSDQIQTASIRYGADANVVIRVSNSSLLPDLENEDNCTPLCQNDTYAIDWTLIYNGTVQSELETGVDKYSLVQNAINTISKNLYERQAVTIDKEQTFTSIKISNVRNIADYVALTQLLKSLSVVESVKLKTVKNSEYEFELTLVGEPRAVIDSLSLDSRLDEVVNHQLGSDIESTVPSFVWK